MSRQTSAIPRARPIARKQSTAGAVGRVGEVGREPHTSQVISEFNESGATLSCSCASSGIATKHCGRPKR